MRTRVRFKWGIRIAECDDLLQVDRKKRSYGTGGLILIDVAKFMAQYTLVRLITTTNENGVAKCEAHHAWAKQPGLKCCFA